MGRLRKWTLGVIGSSVLAALGFTACSGNGIRHENIECVYGPPPEFYSDTLNNQQEEVPDTVVQLPEKDKK